MPGDPYSSTPSPTIRVIENNPDHAILVRLAAERVDPELDVRLVADGLEAVEYLEGRGPYLDRGVHPFPQLVILDLIMPRMDGFGVLEWMRGRPETRDLPVVVLTSSISPRDEARALRLGASGFRTKPADLHLLGEQVRDIVTRWLD